ncbi:acyl carrier protein [Alkalihalophilus marmarensis]|uniref:acyl carrier protein n=1 Tax=Alkalihalophilus marmarensis TaxID=521377 RepID=UPI002DBCB329|nr:acyl carrier protein [Alkalihalophilus marmarensis]MEC2074262.1 acyl carrier protein [Alkalihalophilus marmarensis]
MKTKTAQEDRITNILKELLNKEEIDKSEDLTKIGLDSITSIELIVDLEEEFSIEFDDSELLLSNFETIDLIQKMIEKKANG